MTLVVSRPPLDRAYRAAATQAVAHVGLSQSMAWPLLMIGRHGEGLRQGVLAGLLGLAGPSLGRSLKQLADGGFVERREAPGRPLPASPPASWTAAPRCRPRAMRPPPWPPGRARRPGTAGSAGFAGSGAGFLAVWA